jgi:hypothetical protein
MQEIHAHRLILANASVFFLNSFISGVEESQTGIVKLTADYGLMEKAIRWMYNGQLEYTDGELVGLVELSVYFGIDQLQKLLEAKLQGITDKERLRGVVVECFDKGCAYSLSLLEEKPLFDHFAEFEPQELSDMLDVGTFARLLGRMATYTNEMKVDKIKKFLGQYHVDKLEEKGALFAALTRNDDLKQLLKNEDGVLFDWVRLIDFDSLGKDRKAAD